MPFIGNQPALSYTSFAKQDFTTSATTSYTLDNPVTNENEIALFINFVRQEPTTAYTATGTSLTLTSATSASDDMYCVFLGKAVQTVNPPNASVGASQLIDASITSAKLASGVLPDNTPAFYAYLTGDQTGNGDDTNVKVQMNTELFDTDNCFDNSTNYRFTPTTAGKYFLSVQVNVDSTATSNLRATDVRIYKNGSAIAVSNNNFTENMSRVLSPSYSVIADANGTSDYFEVYAQLNTNNSSSFSILGNSIEHRTFFSGYKILT